jgi:hypothetical protein
MVAHDFFVDAASSQQTTMDFRMQRLDASAHDFGEARVIGYLFYRDPVTYQQLGGAAGGEQFDAALLEFAREFHDSSFVGNA